MLRRAHALAVVLLSLVPFSPAEPAACRDPERQAFVPSGPFSMGSDTGERALARALSSAGTAAADWFSGELTRHEARTGAYCIDRRLVTQAAYAEFVNATSHRAPGISKAEYQQQGFLVHGYDSEVTPYLWQATTPPPGKADHPVVLISAPAAEAYCRWRDPGGRLPTEDEWERAARGNDGRIFPWGNEWDPTRLNSAARGPGGTTPVGHYPAGVSPYGLFDVVGNVFQWTSTRLADGRRVLKGCAWDDDAGLCRPAFRHGRPADSRHILIGFRCVTPR